MAQGNKKGISDETKRHVIWMAHNHKKQEDIAHNLKICLSSVEKILGRYRRESKGLHIPTLRVRGRPQALGAADVNVSHLI
jgi:transposase